MFILERDREHDDCELMDYEFVENASNLQKPFLEITRSKRRLKQIFHKINLSK